MFWDRYGIRCGNSARTIQLIQNHVMDEHDPSMEDSNQKRVVMGGEMRLLDVLDMAGQEENSALRDQYVPTGQGFLCVFAITTTTSLEDIHQYREQIKGVKDSSEGSGSRSGTLRDSLGHSRIPVTQRPTHWLEAAFQTLVREIQEHKVGRLSSPEEGGPGCRGSKSLLPVMSLPGPL
ncbi:PREDICTED: GTPase HRas-like [Odobenus rosmarus divergens]|uniref:GTPase HRas-like n=1 Tax=Odobenus rosmarus divergens TaxID=9708 RepID=A0A2U3X0A7_ODORO|nr:PREDICTED: GTPase HRas-like [Odobenus rosmarus divergens]